MSDRKMVMIAATAAAVGVAAGLAIGEVRPAFAQRIDAAFSTGTFQVSAGNQNEAWRVNTSTGETHHCVSGQGGITCRRAEMK